MNPSVDVGLIAIAATFGLLVVSLVTFISSVLRFRRMRRFAGDLQQVEFSTGEAGGTFDTSLDGLKVEVAADSPSAALLTPLRAGEWMPPPTPAPAASLADASLDARIAQFGPVPNIPEPSFTVDPYEPWQVEPSTPGVPVRETPSETTVLPLSLTLPRVDAGSTASAPKPAMEAVAASDDDLDRELAALMPTTEFAPVAVEPTPVPLAASPPQTVPVSVPGPVSVPEPVTQPAMPPAPAPPPVPAPVAVPVPEPTEQPAPAPASASTPVPVPVAVPVPEPMQQSAPEPEPVFVPVSTPRPAEPVVDTYWEDMLREQQGAPVPRAEPRPPAPRPEVRVATAEPPVAVPEPAPQPSPPRPPRPVARVRSADGEVLRYDPAALQQPVVAPEVTAGRASAPDLVMEAPVEMWFGDSRVGVKAGTATYERFRKYADVLLADLREASARTR